MPSSDVELIINPSSTSYLNVKKRTTYFFTVYYIVASSYPLSAGGDLTNKKDLIIGIDVKVSCRPGWSTTSEGQNQFGMKDVQEVDNDLDAKYLLPYFKISDLRCPVITFEVLDLEGNPHTELFVSF